MPDTFDTLEGPELDRLIGQHVMRWQIHILAGGWGVYCTPDLFTTSFCHGPAIGPRETFAPSSCLDHAIMVAANVGIDPDNYNNDPLRISRAAYRSIFQPGPNGLDVMKFPR